MALPIPLKIWTQKISDFVLRTYALGHQPIEIKIDSENITLDVNLATTLGLILNELATHSLKYAFQKNAKGEISVSFREQNADTTVLNFSDNGIGLPKRLDWKNADTLGLQLINTLVQQLEGHLTMERNRGTQFIISFPPREVGRKMTLSK